MRLASFFPKFAGAAMIGMVAVIAYLPALKIQFYDGWWYLIWSATMDLPRFLIQFLDPAYITQGYRPVQGLYMYLLYHLFQFNPDGYHWAHNLLHAANAILVFLIVARVSQRLRLAFVAGIVYAVLPAYSLGIFWHAVVDPLAGFFYLLTILLWTRYLESQHARDYVITFIAFVCALLSKEIAIFLPLFLFLIAGWFYGQAPNLRRDALRYLPFLIAFVPYLYQVVQVQSHGEFAGQFGFRIGAHMLGNLIPYAAVMAFPWTTELPTAPPYFVWLAVVVIVYAGVMVIKRSRLLLFLALFAGLNISPLLGFPLDYFNTRYLYLSLISSAVVIALIFETAWNFVREKKWLARAIALVAVALVIVSSVQVADAASGLAEYTRRLRVPFRDIARAHPTFPPDTYIYFAYSPLTPIWDFEGLFFGQYGQNVTVNGSDAGKPANLRAHSNSLVYYFDASGKPMEMPVQRDASTQSAPTLPAKFAAPITLEAYEVVSTRIARGKPLIVILNWRADGRIERDYTVFVHLVDARGNVIAQFDSPPWRGKAPTNAWEATKLYVDPIVVPLPADAPLADNLRLEIGMYDAATNERLPILNPDGTTADAIVIQSFSITEK